MEGCEGYFISEFGGLFGYFLQFLIYLRFGGTNVVIFNGNLRLEKLRGEQMYGRTDGQKDVWKFTSVSYVTSALWGRCPKK